MTAVPAPPPPPIAIRELAHLIVEVVPEYTDAYEKRPPVAVKVFGVRHTSTTCRIGIRQGDRRAEAVLTASQLRDLGDRLHDCADLIDPPAPENGDPA